MLLRLVLLMAVLVTGVQNSWGNDRFEQSENFHAMATGDGAIHFRMLCWSEGAINHWAGSKGSKIFVRVAGQTQETEVITYYGSNDNHSEGRIVVNSGNIVITNTSNGERVIVNEGGDRKYTTNGSGSSRYVEFDWYPNVTFANKSLQLRFQIHDDWSAGADGWQRYYPSKSGYYNVDLTNSFQPLQLSDAMFYPLGNDKDAGKIAVPYTLAYKGEWYYTSIAPNDHVDFVSQGGMLFVNSADTTINGFYMVAKAVQVDTGKEKIGLELTSNAVSIPAYHRIHNYKVEDYIEETGDSKGFYIGHKRLTWSVFHAEEGDIMDDDAFVIQRAYKSDFSDAENLGSISLREGTAREATNAEGQRVSSDGQKSVRTMDYEFVDDTDGARFNTNDPERPIYYRVQRASSQVWGSDHAWAATDSVVSPVYLATPDVAKITPTISISDDIRSVQFRIPLTTKIAVGNTEHTTANGVVSTPVYRTLVWDGSAQLVLKRHMSDSQGNNPGVIDVVIPNDNIVFDKTSGCWIATVTDNPNLPCTNYSYGVQVKTDVSTALRKYTKECLDNTLAWHIEGSTGDYFIPHDSLSILPDYRERVIDNLDTKSLYFDKAAKVTNFTIIGGEEPGMYNDHVRLEWNTEAGEGDYFRIYRQAVKKESDTTYVALDTCTLIADMVEDYYYDDYAVKGGVLYRYMVQSVLSCGMYGQMTTADSEQLYGKANRTAHIKGKLQFDNGMAVAGITVIAKAADDTAEYQAVTEADGSYDIVIPDRPSEGEMKFIVAPESTSGYGFVTKTKAPSTDVYVAETIMNINNCDFYSSNFVSFSGRVFYHQTTVPVKGVSFTVNGIKAKNANGNDVTTDSQGNYELTIVKGAEVEIVAHKDKHTFVDKGRFHQGADDKPVYKMQIKENMADMYMYDSTRVRVIGRVAGGDIQAHKPLAMGLSRNNLGDNIKLELALEGNDVAYLFADQKDKLKRENDEYINHVVKDQQTHVHYTQKRVSIMPDSLTGEFVADLLPEKYKVVQATADGYSTLLTKELGTIVIDIADSLNTYYVDSLLVETGNDGQPDTTVNVHFAYNGKFVLTYHAPITLTYKQTNYGVEVDYFGEQKMAMSDFKPEATALETCRLVDGKYVYTFGKPVFNGITYNNSYKNKYMFKVAAGEHYYYNNSTNGTHDFVPISNGRVKVSNGFDANPSSENEFVALDKDGVGMATVTVSNNEFMAIGDDALRHLMFSIEVNGQQVESTTLDAFVTASKQEGSDVMVENLDIVDVLRDPPGSASYAWLESGATYSRAWNWDISYDVGLTFEIKYGQEYVGVQGNITSAPGAYYGNIVQNGKEKTFTYDLVSYADKYKFGYNYSFSTSQRIQTSGADTFVGRDANVFIGVSTPLVVNRKKSYTLISEDTYNRMQGAMAGGELKIITKGLDADSNKVYLAVGNEISFGTGAQTHFAYTQKHIVKNVIPELEAMRKALLYIGSAEEAQAKADATKQTVYYSTVPVNDILFGVQYGRKDPTNIDIKDKEDKIAVINATLDQWLAALQTNERIEVETLYNPSRLTNVSVSAGTSYQYSETAAVAQDYNSPTGYQNALFNNAVGKASGLINSLLKFFWAKPAENGDLIINNDNYDYDIKGFKEKYDAAENDDTKNRLVQELTDKLKGVANGGQDANNNNNDDGSWFKSLWASIRKNMKPRFNFNINGTYDNNKKSSRTIGFKIEEGSNGHISVGVYRTKKTPTEVKDSLGSVDMDDEKIGFFEAFGGIGSENLTNKLPDEKGDDVDLNDDEYQPASYVYMLHGGATRCPYEGPEYTKYYASGTQLSKGTLKIDDPKLKIAKPIISNVPDDQAAVFDLALSCETEAPEVDGGLIDKTLELCIAQETNPNGAKFFIDGQPISQGISMIIPRGEVVHKKLEVYRGTVDDYDDIKLIFYTACQVANAVEASISVHFQPTSSPVKLSSPTDKWVLNTLSPTDLNGEYYIPVKIEGFDVNYRNFDHIELQYKRTTQPDEDYVNLCSYYYETDTLLYQSASGTKKTFKGGVIDDIFFYGEMGANGIEQDYDLRAVTYCRYGNGFVSRSSNVLSGTKDTRLPELFGALSPKNGILGIGDYIGVPFSENIASNHLDATNNFEITGYTNKTGISNSTSLIFNGEGSSKVTTEVTRNLNNKPFTIDLMMQAPFDKNNKRMTLFSHGTETEGVEMGVEAWKLFLKMKHNGKESIVYSDTLPNNGNLKRVSAMYNNESGNVKFYCGNNDITLSAAEKAGGVATKSLAAGYAGVGLISFGNSIDNSTPYNGKMLEARLWTRELDFATLTQTDQVTLTGYERKLLAYYPMNEGKGDMIADVANGANAMMQGQTWSLPLGRSLAFKGEKGVQLDRSYIERSALNNYTLAFWFRADDEQKSDTVALYSELSGEEGDPGLFVGMVNESVVVRQNGNEEVVAGKYKDNNWHQFAMTVDRTSNIANIYMDGMRTNQLAADNFDALASQDVWLGESHTSEVHATSVDKRPRHQFCGYIDDFMLWESALPESYLAKFYNSVPNGGEMGLLVNLTFSASETNSHNMFYNEFNPRNNLVRNERNCHMADSVIVLSDYARAMSTDSVYAPVKEKDLLSNIKFSWASRENELIINLKEPDRSINKQNIFITVRDVEDLAGNMLKDPITWTVFVDRNQLKWGSKYVMRNLKYNEGDEFSVDILNLGGTTLSYAVEDLPDWLSVDDAMGTLLPTEQWPLKFKVADALNPGEHSALIYLTDENGLSEPLYIVVNVKAEKPSWTVDRSKYSDTMNLIGSVKVKDAKNGGMEYYDTDEDDIVAAFAGGECVGVSNISTLYGLGSVYMTIYYSDSEKQTIDFRLWSAKTGTVSNLIVFDSAKNDTISPLQFARNTIVGTPSLPVTMVTEGKGSQIFSLVPGWNWASFNIKPYTGGANFTDAFATKYSFAPGDYIKGNSSYAEYETEEDEDGNVVDSDWAGTLTQFNHKKIYMFRLQNVGNLEVNGSELGSNDVNITLRKGWNELPYYCNSNRTVREAMTAYVDAATEGDIIKSYDEFAMWSNNQWVGSLTVMRPGLGYMLLHQSKDDCTFHYPSQFMAFGDQSTGETPVKQRANVLHYSTNMPIVATTIHEDGTAAEEGDILQAFKGNELVGEAVAGADGKFFLMTSANNGDALSFRVKRKVESNDSEAGVTTQPIVGFDDAVGIGTVNAPFVIDFRKSETGAYPNPFKDHITFYATANVGDEIGIKVYDAAGAVVYTHTGVAHDSKYAHSTDRLANIAKGVYVARISIAGKEYAEKIIKK